MLQLCIKLAILILRESIFCRRIHFMMYFYVCKLAYNKHFPISFISETGGRNYLQVCLEKCLKKFSTLDKKRQ